MYASTSKAVQIMTMIDLDLFYTKVKYGHIGFFMGKRDILYYLETIAPLGLKAGLNIQINKLMKLNENQRSVSLFDLAKRSLRFLNENLLFSETVESFGTKFHIKIYG